LDERAIQSYFINLFLGIKERSVANGGPRASSSPESILFQANPWVGSETDGFARNFALANSTPDARIGAARRDATVARLRSGSCSWNQWAVTMQALARHVAADPAKRRMWSYLAATDLGGHLFETALCDLAGLVFPGKLDLSGASFADTVWFSSSIFEGDVVLRHAQFAKGANFERAVFGNLADFDGAAFGKSGEFRHAVFRGAASFREARFGKDAWFRGARFESSLDMSGASFAGEAGFGDIRYGGPTDFSHVDFVDNAGFEAASFDDVVRFDDARFARNARFEQARFGREPSFDRARFLGRAIFDGIGVPKDASPVRKVIADVMRRLR
jgi:uncharacterized protein YjbI with pentapeptide repeats